MAVPAAAAAAASYGIGACEATIFIFALPKAGAPVAGKLGVRFRGERAPSAGNARTCVPSPSTIDAALALMASSMRALAWLPRLALACCTVCLPDSGMGAPVGASMPTASAMARLVCSAARFRLSSAFQLIHACDEIFLLFGTRPLSVLWAACLAFLLQGPSELLARPFSNAAKPRLVPSFAVL